MNNEYERRERAERQPIITRDEDRTPPYGAWGLVATIIIVGLWTYLAGVN